MGIRCWYFRFISQGGSKHDRETLCKVDERYRMEMLRLKTDRVVTMECVHGPDLQTHTAFSIFRDTITFRGESGYFKFRAQAHKAQHDDNLNNSYSIPSHSQVKRQIGSQPAACPHKLASTRWKIGRYYAQDGVCNVFHMLRFIWYAIVGRDANDLFTKLPAIKLIVRADE